MTTEQILKALSTVDDPDIKKDLVSLNMIKDVTIEGNKVAFTLELTTPACPMKNVIKNNCIEAIHNLVDAQAEVDINITANVTSSLTNLGPNLPKVKNFIAVASGKGGVGKSTVTSNLAVALAQAGAKVGILDADIHGPSQPVMFGIEDQKIGMSEEDGKNWLLPVQRYGVEVMSIGFLTPPGSAVVWRGPMASSAIRQFIGDCKWGELDYMLIDLPPGTSDIHLTLVQSLPITGAIIVTTPQKVALADAEKGLAMFKQEQINVPVLGVVENMAYFTPEELPDNKYYIFGRDGGKRLSAMNDVPFLGEIPLVQGIRVCGDKGVPAVLKEDVTGESFRELAEQLARQVAIRNSTQQASKAVPVQ